MAPIDPAFLTTGGDWGVNLPEVSQPVDPSGELGPTSGAGTGGDGFGAQLGRQIEKLTALQDEAATASRQLATGEATDPTAVVMAVERARLSMQLASQLRTKGVEALNDVFHTQV